MFYFDLLMDSICDHLDLTFTFVSRRGGIEMKIDVLHKMII